MKPESATFIDQAAIMLERARVMLTVDLNEDAGRAAYLAAFHVAQAFIFERTDRVSKTHRGVQAEFFRLTKDDPRCDQTLRRFLSQAYEYKSIADYFSGSSATVSPEDASDAVATARVFIAHFSALVDVADPGY
jgi:uncharacterized protein (UPF0332 family)